jgi:PPM family protein phosphatase
MANAYSYLTVAAITDMGRKRKNNEDAYGLHPGGGVFCVADGMGGVEDGEVASRAAVDAVTAMVDRYARPDAPLSLQAMRVGLTRAVDQASEWIYKRCEERGTRGTGTTFVSVCFDPERPGNALALHAGDSRLYLVRRPTITQITRDHSAAALAGVADERELNPLFRGVVMRAVGVKERVDLECTAFAVAEGDVVLLCSDGLSRMVSDPEILAVLSQEGDVKQAARRLIDAANAHGGVDNVTVVVIRVGSLPVPARAVSPAELAHGETGALAQAASLPTVGAEDPVSDSTRSLPSASATPTTPAPSGVGSDTLFRSDSDEMLVSSPESRPREGVGEKENGAALQAPAVAVVAPTPMAVPPKTQSKKRASRAVRGAVVALVVCAGVVFIQVRRSGWGNGVIDPALTGRAARDGETGKVAAASIQARQQAAELLAREAQAQAAADAERLAREVKARADADAERLARETQAQAAADAERLAREAKARADADVERLAREEQAKADAERRAREAQALAAANAERLAREAKTKADPERLAREAQAKAKVDAERRAREVQEKLVALANDNDVLKRIEIAFSVTTDSKGLSDTLMTNATCLSKAAAMPDAKREDAVKEFVGALAYVRDSKLCEDVANEWNNKIQALFLPWGDADQALKCIEDWRKAIKTDNGGGNLSDPSVRDGLVIFAEKTAKAMMKLEPIPGLIKPGKQDKK